MISAGITGGIGSGKTTVCKLFETLGIPVYYADDRAKWLMVHNETVVKGVTELFGTESYTEGRLNRQHIAAIVFKDKAILAKLNAIVHPAVFEDYALWEAEHMQHAPYLIKEAALLVETGSYKELNHLIVVATDREARIARVMKRDGAEREAVENRMKNQVPQEEKEALADFIIDNNGHKMLIPQVLEIHQKLLKMSRTQ